MNNKSWGGKRKNAGRPVQGNKRVIDNTKVARVSIKDYARIKEGRYDELMQLLYDYKLETVQNEKSKTSPRYQKLNQLLSEVDEIFGSDYTGWID